MRRPRLSTSGAQKEKDVSNGIFVLALAAGAVLLALWVHVRFPSLAPERLGRMMLHAVLAFALLKFVTYRGDETPLTFAAIFLVLLPAIVYALLSAIWALRLAQTALGLGR